MTDDGTDNLTGNFLPEDPDTADALRLADVLERVESGDAPDLDPTEDPALSHLLLTAMRVRAHLGTVNDEHAFHSFYTRSRAAILHSLEPQHTAQQHSNIIPFNRRALIFAPFAAVAAAAAIAITVFSPSLTTGTNTGSVDPAVATNLTARTTHEELDRLATAIADIQTRSLSGQTVPAPLLRAVSEGTARVSNIIEQSPASVSKETVTTYIQAAQNGQNILKSVTVEQDAQGALAAAQRASRDAVVVAGRFLSAAGTATPTATATGTSTATPTASPTPSATGTPTSTATPSPTGTPTATGTPSATPSATATPGSTPTPSATPTPPSDIVR